MHTIYIRKGITNNLRISHITKKKKIIDIPEHYQIYKAYITPPHHIINELTSKHTRIIVIYLPPSANSALAWAVSSPLLAIH